MGNLHRGGVLAAVLGLVLATTASAPAVAGSGPDRYHNPVSAGFADTFADPVVVRGDDGLWYAYGTSDPLREGEKQAHRVPIARSADLVDWTYVGDAFAPDQRPSWAAPGAAFWAPDVRRVGDHWVMYVTVTDTGVSADTFDTAIGAATAPTPTGPWTFADQPVVAPRPGGGGGYLWTIDPSQFTDVDGRTYLYFGSYYGGVSVTELTADGLRAVGTPTLVAVDNKFEGSYVLRHDGWYYLFASTANCCAGPATGYSVQVGRSRGPRGPFVDRDGLRLDASRAGGTPVLTQNGNRWIGTGHNGFLTDLSGQDWIVYHAIDRADPYLDEPFGINERPMLLDRLDWIDGWPTVNAGAGPSEQPRPAPVTTARSRRTLRLPRPDRLAGRRRRLAGGRRAAHRHRRAVESYRGGRRPARGGRPAADRGGRRRAAARPGGGPGGRRAAHRARSRRRHGERSAAGRRRPRRPAQPGRRGPRPAARRRAEPGPPRRPARRGRAAADPPGRPARSACVAEGGTGEFDNVSATRLYRPARHAVAPPRVGPLLTGWSDEFDDGLDPAWQWIRRNPAATVADGALRWPVESTDLVGTGNTAGVLLRDAPTGDYVAETKVTLDLGEETVRNYQQAGLVAYVDDDRFARLCQVAIWNTRQVEYGYELPFAGQPVYGGSIVGTPATTTWLRLAHHVDPATGEHEFRAGSSRDGTHWTWGAVWTFPADTTPRIGLVAHGGANPPVTAEFDYLRFRR